MDVEFWLHDGEDDELQLGIKIYQDLIYLQVYGDDGDCFLTAGEARHVAAILVHAAQQLEMEKK